MHLPPDAICLWQDLVAPSTNVYLLQPSSFEVERKEMVEKIPCSGTARHAVVLLFTWEGVGHYELVTFNDVTTLPHSHAFHPAPRSAARAVHAWLQRVERKRRGTSHGSDVDEVLE